MGGKKALQVNKPWSAPEAERASGLYVIAYLYDGSELYPILADITFRTYTS
jgi:hypothetical protein